MVDNKGGGPIDYRPDKVVGNKLIAFKKEMEAEVIGKADKDKTGIDQYL